MAKNRRHMFSPLQKRLNFFEACNAGHLDIVRSYLKQGDFDINALDPNTGASGLMLAVAKSQSLVVKVLMDAGADTNMIDSNGRSVYHHAAQSGSIFIYHKLLERNALDVDHVDNTGKTPLMIAARRQNIDILRKLLQRGANPNKQDDFGKTALMHALKANFPEGVEHLLTYYADIRIQDYNGKTVRDYISPRPKSGRKGDREIRCIKAINEAKRKNQMIEAIIMRAKNLSMLDFNLSAVKFQHVIASNVFDKYVDHCLQADKKIAPLRFYKKGSDRINALDILIYMGKLDTLWNKALWQGREEDLEALYNDGLIGWLKKDQQQNYNALKLKYQIERATNQSKPPSLKRRK